MFEKSEFGNESTFRTAFAYVLRVALIAVIAFPACGGGDDDNDTARAATTSTTSTLPPTTAPATSAPEPTASPDCEPDPSFLGDLLVGTVDVDGNGEAEVWYRVDTGTPQTIGLATRAGCEYADVMLDGAQALFQVGRTGNTASGVRCDDEDGNGALDFTARLELVSNDGGATYLVTETRYALTGSALSQVSSNSYTVQGGASIIGDYASLHCGAVNFP